MDNSYALDMLPLRTDQPKKRKAAVHEDDLPEATGGRSSTTKLNHNGSGAKAPGGVKQPANVKPAA